MPAYAPLIDLAALDPGDGYFVLGAKRGGASGWSVTAGDFNRDHIDDLLIGAPASNASAGGAHVVFGADGPPPAAVELKTLPASDGFALAGPAAEVNLGTGGAAGDLNGDGVDDLIVAAQFADAGGELDSGQVYVVFGKRGGAPLSLDLGALDGAGGFKVEGHAHAENLGCAVASADVNGDGIDDLIVGAPSADPAVEHSPIAHEGSPRGVTYVYFGRTDGWPDHIHGDEADLAFIGHDPEGRAGAGVAAGDFDGDGRADLIVGAPDSAEFAGAGFVLYGATGLAGEIEAEALDGLNGLAFTGFGAVSGGGRNVAAGDLDGDGRTDAAFAAPTANGSAGAVHLAFGRPAGAAEIDLSAPDGLSSVRIDGLAAGDALGDALEIGDVNGDAVADLVVAATGAGGPGREGAGVVYVVFGRAGGWDPVIDLAGLDGSNGYAILGQSLGAAMGYDIAIGDVDGDRLADIAIGGWEGGNQTGQTAVVLGRLAREAVDRPGTGVNDLVHGGIRGDMLGGGGGDDLVIGHKGDDSALGGGGSDRLAGGDGSDSLWGGSGEDRLRGRDGDDLITGGRGADRLTGGLGVDAFAFEDVRDSRRDDVDVIVDLAAEDVIDLSAIDADASTGADDAFALVAAFGGNAGEAVLVSVGADTELRLDTDGDGLADAAVLLLGDHVGHTGFVL